MNDIRVGDPHRLWDDAEDEILFLHYKRGRKSATVLARELGRTRNEVIGRAHRLGLSSSNRHEVRFWPI